MVLFQVVISEENFSFALSMSVLGLGAFLVVFPSSVWTCYRIYNGYACQPPLRGNSCCLCHASWTLISEHPVEAAPYHMTALR